jgi:uncharacterized protein YacL
MNRCNRSALAFTSWGFMIALFIGLLLLAYIWQEYYSMIMNYLIPWTNIVFVLLGLFYRKSWQ